MQQTDFSKRHTATQAPRPRPTHNPRPYTPQYAGHLHHLLVACTFLMVPELGTALSRHPLDTITMPSRDAAFSSMLATTANMLAATFAASVGLGARLRFLFMCERGVGMGQHGVASNDGRRLRLR